MSALLVAAAPAVAADRSLASAQSDLARGREFLVRAESDVDKGTTARLRSLERARSLLKRARLAAHRGTGGGYVAVSQSVDRALVRTLVDEAEIHYGRKSLPLARERVNEALALDPDDTQAQDLLARVEAAESHDFDDEGMGIVGLARLAGRRAEAGMPLRDRGYITRRVLQDLVPAVGAPSKLPDPETRAPGETVAGDVHEAIGVSSPVEATANDANPVPADVPVRVPEGADLVVAAAQRAGPVEFVLSADPAGAVATPRPVPHDELLRLAIERPNPLNPPPGSGEVPAPAIVTAPPAPPLQVPPLEQLLLPGQLGPRFQFVATGDLLRWLIELGLVR